MTYHPHPDGSVCQVLQFFQRNPDEELTASDAAAKFDLRITSLRGTLAQAVAHGLLAYVPTGRGRQMVYRAGPALATYQELAHG